VVLWRCARLRSDAPQVPLTPDNVRVLVKEHGLRVLVQPSPKRVFADAEYVEAGAEMTDDLSAAWTILGVKEVPPAKLLPGKNYVFFSHTIKAQPYNMGLLDTILEKKIRLVDYECITQYGRRADPRLVAFGRFAGIAGAVDFMRGLGERFLNKGFSTPFLSIGATYMYPNERAWRAAVVECGERIARIGLPEEMCPFVCAVTGNGNVAKGVEEILELLPHEWVIPEDLPAVMGRSGREHTHKVFLVEANWDHIVRRRATPARASPSPVSDAVEVPVASAESYHDKTSFAANDPLASRDEYRSNPERYENCFAEMVAPFVSALFVCNYWDARYPRVLTIKQTQSLQRQGRLRLEGVCDISCDMRGSVEFLSKFTSIEHPYYVWEVEKDTVHDTEGFMSKPGVLFHAVDHLPSECPLEASMHFGRCLLQFVPALARADPEASLAELGPTIDDDSKGPVDEETERRAAESCRFYVPPAIRGALITNHGAMAPRFTYILKLRAANESASAKRLARLRRHESYMTVRLTGHLFDSGAINRVLDAVELVPGASVDLTSVSVGRSTGQPSQIYMALFSHNPSSLPLALKAVVDTATAHHARVDVDPSEEPGSTVGKLLADQSSDATDVGASDSVFADTEPPTSSTAASATLDASLGLSPPPTSHSFEPYTAKLSKHQQPRIAPPRKVLLLGAGMVTKPLVEYLLRRPGNVLTVCSGIPGEAEKLCAERPRCHPHLLAVDADPSAEQPQLETFIRDHDIVLSMLPAFLHVPVARLCVAHKKHLVTASYVSPGMQELDAAAKENGVLLLNEMGVDPGIDHMSAMRMIESARKNSETIVGFESCTGGLPAPEAADNPFGYKFSWSPRGALVAARNAALYYADGVRVEVPGTQLLTSAKTYRAGRGFALEVLPNRDSTSYAPKYGLCAVSDLGSGKAGVPLTVFRGTLRYEGFSRLMVVIASLGMLDAEPCGKGFDAVLDAAAATEDEGARPSLREWLSSRLGLSASSSDEALVAAACDKGDATLSEAGRDPLTPAQRVLVGQMLRFSTLLSNTARVPSLPEKSRSSVDALARVLGPLEGMNFQTGQRDMVVMQHRLTSVKPTGETIVREGRLVEYAQNGDTAMARTVGLTAAIGAQLILDNAIELRGVVTPEVSEVYDHVLELLESEGITMVESEVSA
jgi:alpha-aminoadipic semialdehyde synthase